VAVSIYEIRPYCHNDIVFLKVIREDEVCCSRKVIKILHDLFCFDELLFVIFFLTLKNSQLSLHTYSKGDNTLADLFLLQ